MQPNPIFTVLLWLCAYTLAKLGKTYLPRLAGIIFILLMFLMMIAEVVVLVMFAVITKHQ